jgi:hypothetical protein
MMIWSSRSNAAVNLGEMDASTPCCVEGLAGKLLFLHTGAAAEEAFSVPLVVGVEVRNFPVNHRIEGPVHHAHSASADTLFRLVTSEFGRRIWSEAMLC